MDVAVIVQGAPASPGLREVLLATCSAALKHRVCVAGAEDDVPSETGGSEATDVAPAMAIITWPDGDLRHVRVVLAQSGAPVERWLSHETRFADEDPVRERWRAVGLTIAALMGGADADRAASPESPAVPASIEQPTRESSDVGLRPDQRGRGWVGLAAVVGPGLDDGSVRAGAQISAGQSLGKLPIFLTASGGYAFRPEDAQHVSVQWLTVGAGAGFAWELPRIDLGLRARAELVFEQVKAKVASTPLSGGERWTPGVRGGVEGAWPSRGRFAIIAGLELWGLTGGTGIRLDHRMIGSSGWLSFAGVVGGQCSFP